MRALIFDRDGVINHDSTSYIKTAAECVLIEEVTVALQAFPKNTYFLFIASNQAGLAKEVFSSRDLARIHQKILTQLKNAGIFLEGIFFCPHSDDAKCHCRKPKAGLLNEIIDRYPNLIKPIPFIGDSQRDLVAAEVSACLPVLVLTGNGQETLKNKKITSETLVIDDLVKGVPDIKQAMG